MNPRTAPKPNLARLQTSTPHRKQSSPQYSSNASPSSTMIHRSASQPSSAARRDHNSKDARSVSPPRSRGFRPAFRNINWGDSQRRPDAVQQSNAQGLALLRGGSVNERRKNLGDTVSPLANITENSAAATIQSRRALKAGPGDSTPKRHPLTVDTHPQQRNHGASRDPAGKADASYAVNDAEGCASDTGRSDPSTPTGVDVKEKRLPTLPNTPSSVMDEAVRAIDERDKALNAEVLCSHFSSLTADESLHSRLVCEKSRFSEWSTDTENHSPESMVLPSSFNCDKRVSCQAVEHESPAVDDSWKTPDLSSQPTDATTSTDPNTPHLTANSKPSSPNSASGDIPPWNVSLPQLTVSLSTPTGDTTGLGIDSVDEEVESNPKRHAALFSALESLARSRSGSPIILKRESGPESKEGNNGQGHTVRDDASLRGQRTMQELMDELSYLKNMIQAEMDGSPF